MSKKSTTTHPDTVFGVDDFAPKRQKLLGIKQIREYAERLLAVPSGAAMPDWSDLTIGDRFAIALRLVPGAHWEQLLGKVDAQLRRYEKGVDIPFTVIAALAAETEIPMEWFVSGRAMDRQPPLVRISPDAPQADPEDVPIQKLAFKVSAGSGNLMLDDKAEHVRFPRAILQHVGISPSNARLFEASGDSMKSTINDGDMLLVDVSPAASQIVEGKIYAFSVGDDAFVKRLRKMGDETIMISDNRELFPEQSIPKHVPFRVYGRVKWAGKSL